MSESAEEAAKPARRTVVRGLGVAAGGLLVGGVTGSDVADATAGRTMPASAMAVPSAGPWRPAGGHVDVTWAVDTDQKLVALTFDDGPMPNWTGMVHDILDAEKIRATFFLVGDRLVRNARLVHGRMERHEAGNHTWSHCDLAHLQHDQAYDQLHRAHAAIARIVGKEPRHLRPPFGHLGGTTLSAAARLGYDLTLWTVKMLERTYQRRPAALVDYIVDHTGPGTIILAHDTGRADRLVALRNLVPMIRRLTAEGFEFVTVSELMASSRQNSARSGTS
jgi:peptidoglycan/xylan/chitin deacetylase (PgdA/CDA1 family)